MVTPDEVMGFIDHYQAELLAQSPRVRLKTIRISKDAYTVLFEWLDEYCIWEAGTVFQVAERFWYRGIEVVHAPF